MNEDQTTGQRPDSVVWIDERHAILAQLNPAGEISTVEIRRLQQPEGRYLGHVVHAIAGHEHVMVVGPQPMRLALERRFVAVGHRPDRLVAAQPSRRVAAEKLVEGLERFAA
ncbi:MAG TPA: hypothetical protein VFP56_03690, partial [Candidatus Limnocylindrales bacterium]|nr:hypothetical protein [Candidatus Limnocylindrales bacterium]